MAHQRVEAVATRVGEGALFSTGDGHFAQSDGEVCVTAVEMGATVAVRFRVVKDVPARAMRGPRFSHPGYFAPPEWAAPRGFVAAMGMPINVVSALLPEAIFEA